MADDLQSTADGFTTIKVKDSQKNAINSLVSAGEAGSQADIIALFLSLWKKQKAEESGKAVPYEESMQYHMHRIAAIYSEGYYSQQDKLTLADETIAILNEDLKTIKLRLYESSVEMDKLTKEQSKILLEREEEIERIRRDAQTEVENARGSAAVAREQAAQDIDRMREAVAAAQKAEQQAAQLLQLTTTAADAAQEKADRFEQKAEAADSLQASLTLAQAKTDDLEKTIEIMKSIHDQELKRIKDEADLARREASLEVERRYVSQINDLNAQLTKAREESLNIEKNYVKQISELGDQLSKVREANADLRIKMSLSKE